MNTELIEKTGSDAGQRVTTFIVHCNGETRVVKASEHDAVGIIIERGRFGTDTDEMNIFLGEFDGSLIEAVEIEDGEDDHKPIGRHEKPGHHSHGGGVVHVHCHKCHRVKVVFGTRPEINNGLQVTFDGWVGATAPVEFQARLGESEGCVLAGVAAAALAVSEVFLSFASITAEATNRLVGVSLWRPDLSINDASAVGPKVQFLPAEFVSLGLGHLLPHHLKPLVFDGRHHLCGPGPARFIVFSEDLTPCLVHMFGQVKAVQRQGVQSRQVALHLASDPRGAVHQRNLLRGPTPAQRGAHLTHQLPRVVMVAAGSPHQPTLAALVVHRHDLELFPGLVRSPLQTRQRTPMHSTPPRQMTPTLLDPDATLVLLRIGHRRYLHPVTSHIEPGHRIRLGLRLCPAVRRMPVELQLFALLSPLRQLPLGFHQFPQGFLAQPKLRRRQQVPRRTRKTVRIQRQPTGQLPNPKADRSSRHVDQVIHRNLVPFDAIPVASA